MQKFKELIIKKTPCSSLPHLRLQGKWLEQLSFTVGTSVTAVYKDACLTLKTETLTLLEDHVSEKYVFTTCVTSRLIGNKPRTQLFLNGLLLQKYGFNLGDRVGLVLAPNTIQISKIISYTTECS